MENTHHVLKQTHYDIILNQSSLLLIEGLDSHHEELPTCGLVPRASVSLLLEWKNSR